MDGHIKIFAKLWQKLCHLQNWMATEASRATWEGPQEFEETTQLKSTRKRTEEKTEMAKTRVES